MKKTYTKKQIQEAIRYWTKQLNEDAENTDGNPAEPVKKQKPFNRTRTGWELLRDLERTVIEINFNVKGQRKGRSLIRYGGMCTRNLDFIEPKYHDWAKKQLAEIDATGAVGIIYLHTGMIHSGQKGGLGYGSKLRVMGAKGARSIDRTEINLKWEYFNTSDIAVSFMKKDKNDRIIPHWKIVHRWRDFDRNGADEGDDILDTYVDWLSFPNRGIQDEVWDYARKIVKDIHTLSIDKSYQFKDCRYTYTNYDSYDKTSGRSGIIELVPSPEYTPDELKDDIDKIDD